jgi:hypothetical protein
MLNFFLSSLPTAESLYGQLVHIGLDVGRHVNLRVRLTCTRPFWEYLNTATIREGNNCSGNRFVWVLHGSPAAAQLDIGEGLDVRGELRSLFSPTHDSSLLMFIKLPIWTPLVTIDTTKLSLQGLD